MAKEEIPEKIGRYRPKKFLGRGAMGVVYLADDPIMTREVAIKVLKLDPYNFSIGQRQLLIEKFADEVKLLAKLKYHPGIVQVFDQGCTAEDEPYIVMEFVDGISLSKALEARFPSQKDVVEIVAGVADAIDYLGANDVVHRDIKPANIIIQPNHKPKLVDFGVAKKTIGEPSLMTQMGMIGGTIPYMSPEQLEGKVPDAKSDQYALAVVTYEMLTGHRPFYAPDDDEEFMALRGLITADQPCPRPILNLNHWLKSSSMPVSATEAVLRKALSRKKDDRYETCAKFAEKLQAALRGSKSVSRLRSIVLVACLAITLGLVAAVWYARAENGTLTVLNRNKFPVEITSIVSVYHNESGRLSLFRSPPLNMTIDPNSKMYKPRTVDWDGSVVFYEMSIAYTSGTNKKQRVIAGLWKDPYIELPAFEQ